VVAASVEDTVPLPGLSAHESVTPNVDTQSLDSSPSIAAHGDSEFFEPSPEGVHWGSV